MPRNPEEYSYTPYSENYYDGYEYPHTQQQQQHPQYHQQQHQQQHYHQQQQQQHYPHVASGYPHPQAAYYSQGHQMQPEYSTQAGPSYYTQNSQPYTTPVEDDESPPPSVPYDDYSPTQPSFGQFQVETYGNNDIEHIITEHDLPPAEVASYFPSSNKTDIHTDKGVIWRCKMCSKEVPARNKIEHIFKHKDQPRYTCSCKAKFARGQDKNRHLKEQALCTSCQMNKVGRRGQNGNCQTCSGY